MIGQMRGRHRGGSGPDSPQSLWLAAGGVLLLLAMIAAVVWTQARDQAAWTAKHGRCLEWLTVSHAPVHRDVCIRAERP